MKSNKNIAILIFLVLLVTIGAVFFLKPKTGGDLKAILADPVKQGKVLVYFSKSKGSEEVTEPVMRDLPKPRPSSGMAIIRFAVSELLKGPTPAEKDSGYFSEVPKGTRLISVAETPKKIDVNLSGEFTSGGGSNSMTQRLMEVTKTVVSVRQKKPVYLSVDGSRLDVLGGEGVMVHEPITDDPSLSQ